MQSAREGFFLKPTLPISFLTKALISKKRASGWPSSELFFRFRIPVVWVGPWYSAPTPEYALHPPLAIRLWIVSLIDES